MEVTIPCIIENILTMITQIEHRRTGHLLTQQLHHLAQHLIRVSDGIVIRIAKLLPIGRSYALHLVWRIVAERLRVALPIIEMGAIGMQHYKKIARGLRQLLPQKGNDLTVMVRG